MYSIVTEEVGQDKTVTNGRYYHQCKGETFNNIIHSVNESRQLLVNKAIV